MVLATHNSGFDVILSNSQGDMLYESIKALAPLGHLIDVGRLDVISPKNKALELFQKSASFTSFDLGLVIERDVSFGEELMQLSDEHYKVGYIGLIRPYSVCRHLATCANTAMFLKGHTHWKNGNIVRRS